MALITYSNGKKSLDSTQLLQTIQMQMASICKDWNIPYLDLSDIKNPADIPAKLEEIVPKIILTSIEDISNHAVQSQLQTLNVSYIAIDECQVKSNNMMVLPIWYCIWETLWSLEISMAESSPNMYKEENFHNLLDTIFFMKFIPG